MYKCLPLLLLFVSAPVCAWNIAALERALLNPDGKNSCQIIQANSLSSCVRSAIRLGYDHFHNRVNTPHMTPTDVQIAELIQNRLQPLFNKIDSLSKLPQQEQNDLRLQYSEEFAELINEMSVLFFKNQSSYSKVILFDSQAAQNETLTILQEALARGTF